MRTRFPILLLLLLACSAHAQETDSTAMLFDQTVVHEWNLQFYVEGWEDSLTANYENGEEYMPARVIYDGMVFDSVGVRYKGNSSYMLSRGTPKKPLKFKFDEYRDEQTCYGEKKLNFSNCVKDPSFLREMLAYGVIARYVPSSRTAYATISIDGELLGLYVQVEQVDKTFLKRHFEDNDFNLYKADDNGATMLYRGTDKEAYRAEFELQTNEKEDDWTRLITMLDLLNNTPSEQLPGTLAPWLDLDAAMCNLAFQMVLSNFDSYSGSSRNYYLYDDETTGRFTMMPWDLNEAFGAYTNNWNVVTQDIVSPSNLAQRPLMRQVLENGVLRQRYLRFVRDMLDGPASHDSLAARAAIYRSLIDSYVQADVHQLYSYQKFLDNLENEVVVGLNMRVPGVLSFVRDRTAAIRTQLGTYLGSGEVESSTAATIGDLDIWPQPLTSCMPRCAPSWGRRCSAMRSAHRIRAGTR